MNTADMIAREIALAKERRRLHVVSIQQLDREIAALTKKLQDMREALKPATGGK